jgi:surfactin synthase thioesterase subunit
MKKRPINLLLIPGLARETHQWETFSQILEEQIIFSKTHLLELPGVSEKINLESFKRIETYTNELREEWLYLKDKHQGSWIIMAFSMGGMIGVDWCNRFPYDMTSLILINSFAGNLSLPPLRFDIKAMGKVLGHFLKEGGEHPIEKGILLKQIYTISRYKVPSELNCAIKVLASKKDNIVSYKCSEAIAKHFSTKVTLHKESGHSIHLDDPKWLIDQVEDFLKNL